MGTKMMNRRTFSQLLAMSLAATAAPVPAAWAQAKKRNVVIGHTGPHVAGPPRHSRCATWLRLPPPPDPVLNETIFKDVSELGFAGVELFDWQISGLESQGLLAGFVEEYKLPLIASYTNVNLTDPRQRAADRWPRSSVGRS